MPAAMTAAKKPTRSRSSRKTLAPAERNTVPAETPNPLRVVPEPTPTPQATAMTSFGGVSLVEDKPKVVVLPVITQIREAWKNKAAFLFGVPFGAALPGAIFYGVHFEVRPLLLRLITEDGPWYDWARLFILCAAIIGGLYVSAKTVYRWGQAAFRDNGQPDNGKAAGTVALLEIWMTFASNIWFSAVLLVFLVVINGLSTACNFSLNAKQDRPRR